MTGRGLQSGDGRFISTNIQLYMGQSQVGVDTNGFLVVGYGLIQSALVRDAFPRLV